MERLTRTDWKTMIPMECCGQKDYCIRRREAENACLNCIVPKLYVRVAAFEDAGVPMQKAVWMKEIIEEAFSNDTSRIERAHDLHVADKEGRVVVLPCKQGDELWTYCNYPVKRVYSFVVSDVTTMNGRAALNTLGIGTIRPEDIGKTVFLTREEAERALEEKNDG